MTICTEKAGFLFSHACKEASVFACSTCQKAICEKHTHRDQLDNVCTTCARKKRGQERTTHTKDPYLDRDYYYDRYGYYGVGYWGDDYYYDDHDFTEADGMSLRDETDDGFESDMGAS